MRGMAFKLMIFCSLLVATAFAVQFAVADSGGNGEIEIKAPIEAVNCAGVPPTVTLLGLIIDISQVKDDNGGVFDCASLVLGDVVEVELVSDVPNQTTGLLTAVELEDEGQCVGGGCVEIEAPIQFLDSFNQTITVLGLVIDISQAEISGDDDAQGNGNAQGDEPSAPITLMAGQFVEVALVSNVPPLVATEVQVQNSGTGIEVEIVDQNGNEIEDEDDDIQITATVTTSSINSGLIKSGVTGGKKKTLTFSAHSNGSVRLSGLPPGKAKLVIKRINSSGKGAGKASAIILPQQTTHVVTRLKQAK